MQFILDYDLTLSDYHHFIVDSKPYKSDGLWVTPAIWDILDARTYLYDDVIPFLQGTKKDNVRILTAMSPLLGPEAREFQRVKLERSGLAEYVSDIVFMEGDKGPYIKEMYQGVPTVFIDDKLVHLQSAKKCCPDIDVVHMVRPGTKDMPGFQIDSDIPTVSSLTQLSKLFTP